MFEQFAQVLTIPDLSQFRFVLADTMNLQYSYSTAKRTRDFFEMIVRYINVLLLLNRLATCSRWLVNDLW